MALEDNELVKFYIKHKKGIHAIEGIFVILLLILLNVNFYKSEKLQEEISLNCGWETEDYECYCQRDDALALKSDLFDQEINLTIDGDLTDVDR